MKKRKNYGGLSKFDVIKLILIFGLLLFIIDSLFNLSLEIFGIGLSWLLIYIGGIVYFIIGEEPFLKSLKYLKEIKNYIWFSVILFFGIGIFGYLFPVFFEEQMLKLIADLIEQTEGLGACGLIRFIFLNNVKGSFFAILFGIFLGIVPIAVVVINGYVLGFVTNKTVASEGFLILWRLLPHGIFELPAVLISIAVGLRLGSYLFVCRGNIKPKEFKKWLIDALRAFILIVVPLLVIAALIEGVLIFLVS